MKIVSVLSLVAIVGVLGLAIFFVSSSRSNVAITSNAAGNVTVSGKVVSPNREKCVTSYYIGCYVLKGSNGERYQMIENTSRFNLDQYVGSQVTVVGQVSKTNSLNVLIVSSIRRSP